MEQVSKNWEKQEAKWENNWNGLRRGNNDYAKEKNEIEGIENYE